MAASQSEQFEEKETGRVEAFSDGVFAIAITLLILEIVVKVPHDVENGEGLANALLHLWPSYLAFLTSFGTIGVMWINHHRLFNYVRRVDHGLLIYNTLLLLGITFVPFPTALLAEYITSDKPGAANVAALVYSGSGTVIAIFYNLLWRHIAFWGKLLGRQAAPAFVDGITRAYRFGPLYYLVAFAVAPFTAWGSFGITMALALFFALPQRLMDKKTRHLG